MRPVFRRLPLRRKAVGICRQRCFFSMPNPFDLAPGPQTYSEQKVFPCVPVRFLSRQSLMTCSYSHQEVYSIVADVASYCQFVPFCTGSRILDATTDSTGKVHLEAELTVGFPPFTESYVSNVTCTPNVSVEVRCSMLHGTFVDLSCRPSLHRPHPYSRHCPPSGDSSQSRLALLICHHRCLHWLPWTCPTRLPVPFMRLYLLRSLAKCRA